LFLVQVSGEKFEDLYKRQVWQRIQESREHLQHLHPLAYRLEVMEDIFSLLFCRHGDLRDGAMAGERESEEDESSMPADSLETSLNMFVVSEEDVTADADQPLSTNQREKDRDADATKSSSKDKEQKDANSAIGSMGSLDRSGKSSLSSEDRAMKLKRTGSFDYDTPFPDEREKRDKMVPEIRRLRFRSMDSSDTPRPSSVSENSCGFLANEYVVRDVLAMLKEAVLDLNAVKFRLQGQGQSKETGKKAGSREAVGSPSRSSAGGKGAASTATDSFNPALEKLLSTTVRSWTAMLCYDGCMVV
jgi:zinc finger FYVE domain-containing protein 26